MCLDLIEGRALGCGFSGRRGRFIFIFNGADKPGHKIIDFRPALTSQIVGIFNLGHILPGSGKKAFRISNGDLLIDKVNDPGYQFNVMMLLRPPAPFSGAS